MCRVYVPVRFETRHPAPRLSYLNIILVTKFQCQCLKENGIVETANGKRQTGSGERGTEKLPARCIAEIFSKSTAAHTSNVCLTSKK